jgi:hypothetical protein
MGSRIWLAFLTLLALLTFTGASQAKIKTTCFAFGQPCECAWFVRDCLPTCRIKPRLCVTTALQYCPHKDFDAVKLVSGDFYSGFCKQC